MIARFSMAVICWLVLTLTTPAQIPGLTVGSYTLVSQARVGRTVYDYTYRAMISNVGPSAASGVTATLTSLAAGTTVIDGSLSFGAVAAGAAVPSQDAFTIRVDRSFPFSDSNLVWTIHCTTCLKGILLEGSPGLPVRSAVRNLDLNDGIPEDQISLDANGLRIARTEVEIWFRDQATAGQVNALLASFGGRIVNMLHNVPIVLVRIPDPGTVTGLEGVLAWLRSSPVVISAEPGSFPAPKEVPPNYVAGVSDFAIDHHLAVRGHAAWNVRAAIETAPPMPPRLIVADYFGAGPPAADFNFDAWPPHFASTVLDAHGYHVLGIIGADFGGMASNRGRATGLYPSDLDLWAVDFQSGITDEAGDFRLVTLISNAVRGVVVNSSIGYDYQDFAGYLETVALVPADAVKWIEKVRGAGVEGKYIHVNAAGNNFLWGFDADARLNSPFTAAALLANLTRPDGTPVANLGNALVVENQINSPAAPYRPICLKDTSNYPGNISAIGTDVWSLTGPAAGAGNMSGTSMAAPQVAALAAYVWALNPSLSAQQVTAKLLGTARHRGIDPGLDARCNGAITPAPAIDAYDAVLSVDSGMALQAGDLAGLRVRNNLFDVADGLGREGTNGGFDDKDVELLLARLGAAGGAPDYSRYDLNGDGYTGGGGTERFDLDINDPSAFTTVEQQIEGENITFDETKLTDQQILCYYAYSPLYKGNADRRTELLCDKCGPPSLKLIISGGQYLPGPEPPDPKQTWLAWASTDRTWNQSGVFDPAAILPLVWADADLWATGGLEIRPAETMSFRAQDSIAECGNRDATMETAIAMETDARTARLHFSARAINNVGPGPSLFESGFSAAKSELLDTFSFVLQVNNPGAQDIQLELWLDYDSTASMNGSGNFNISTAAWVVSQVIVGPYQVAELGRYCDGPHGDHFIGTRSLRLPPGRTQINVSWHLQAWTWIQGIARNTSGSAFAAVTGTLEFRIVQ